MLMRFMVENHACFGEEVTLSLVATATPDHPGHLITKAKGEPLRLVRAAGLYGANGHGKTRLVDAMAFAQKLVVQGTPAKTPIATNPFRLDPARRNAPSRFEFAFHHHDVDYDYGFVVDHRMVREEWLFRRTAGEEERLFERVTAPALDSDTENNADERQPTVTVEFGQPLLDASPPGFLPLVAAGTRPNQLFLHEAADRNVTLLSAPYAWFKDTLTVLPAGGRYAKLLMRLREHRFLDFVHRFIKGSDTGIERLSVRLVKLELIHKDQKDEEVIFKFDDESAGTQQLLYLLPILFDLTTEEKVFVVDEIDRTLHPLLSYRFLEVFLGAPASERGGQLIFTTHNTHLLDRALLRPDEIWFIEKRPSGSAALYALSEFQLRPGLDLEKGYLHGRFGAVPFLGDPAALGWPSAPTTAEGEGEAPC